jgi:subtilisin family serine protease
VLDTGIAKNHPDFDFTKITSQNFIVKNTPADDQDGHGTHDAGIIGAKGFSKFKGIAPDVSLFIYKVTTDENSVGEQPVLDAIDQAMRDNVHIISMSFVMENNTPALHKKIQDAYNKGIILVAASGNDGVSTSRYPASYNECLAIGGIDRSQAMAAYNSYPKVKSLDLLAPGTDIFSTYTSPQWQTKTGTSPAAAFVSGVLALLLSWTVKNKPQLTSRDVVKALKDSSVKYGSNTYNTINPLNALQLLKNS